MLHQQAIFAADLEQYVDDGVLRDGWTAARTLKYRCAFQFCQHLFRVQSRNRTDTKRHVGQHFNENSTEAHHHHRPEIRIPHRANHDLLSGRGHFLDQITFDARAFDGR